MKMKELSASTWSREGELRQALEDLRPPLLGYANVLAQMAGVPCPETPGVLEILPGTARNPRASSSRSSSPPCQRSSSRCSSRSACPGAPTSAGSAADPVRESVCSRRAEGQSAAGLLGGQGWRLERLPPEGSRGRPAQVPTRPCAPSESASWSGRRLPTGAPSGADPLATWGMRVKSCSVAPPTSLAI
jgi:hypothetical protein